MEWTPDQIRSLVNALERRRGREVRLTPETLGLVIEALRFFSMEGYAERCEGYRIDVWDVRRGTIVEAIGHMTVLGAAEAVYAAACAARPGAEVTLRQGARTVRVRRPSEDGGLQPSQPGASPVTAR